MKLVYQPLRDRIRTGVTAGATVYRKNAGITVQLLLTEDKDAPAIGALHLTLSEAAQLISSIAEQLHEEMHERKL